MVFRFRFLFIALILNISALNLYTQVNFNFENNLLTGWEESTSNRWGITDINPISGSYSLHHEYDNASSGTDQISVALSNVPDSMDTIVWSFRLKYGYKPSSANNWAFFLASDLPSKYMVAQVQSEALILGVNFTGSDDLLKIWKQQNDELIPVLTSSFNWETKVSDSAALLVVVRFPNDSWTVRVAPSGKASDLKEALSGKIDFFPDARYCGLYYKYSSSQDRQLWFDDFQLQANFTIDTIAPKADTCFLVGNSVLQLSYNEVINKDKISKESFIFNDKTIAIDSIFILANRIQLYLANPLASGTKIDFTVNGMEDIKGNVAKDLQFSLFYYEANAHDIAVSEIMYDPDPAVNLPNAEYIELYNRSEYPINLASLKLGINTSMYSIAPALIQPKEYYILTSFENASAFKSFGKCIGAWNSTYALSNEGAYISISDSVGNLISYANYTGNWIDDKLKADGGWSLEMVDINYPCDDKVNWKVSENKNGGTPGALNSVAARNSDVLSPEIESARVLSDSTLIITFTESIDCSMPLQEGFFTVNKGIGSPSALAFEPQNYSSVRLTFAQKFKTRTVYNIIISDNLHDCAGNKLSTNEIKFALPEEPDSFDVVINELLFNGFPNSGDFVELYNRSSKTIDFGKLVFAVIDSVSGKANSFCNIASEGNLIFPGSYIVITKDINELTPFYYLKNKNVIFQTATFSSLPDKSGIVALLSRNLQTIDRFSYNENMHVAFLSSKEGVSLERLSTQNATQMTGNWLSASQTSGFATPGYENSQKQENEENKNSNYIVEPEVFSPNMDGVDDVTLILINGLEKPATATINIYNVAGVLVRNLLNRSYIDSEFKVNWDGTSNLGRLQPTGIYIVHIMLVFSNGETREIKRSCVLGKR